MRIDIELTDNEAMAFKELLLRCRPFESLGFTDEEGDDVCSACNKIENAIDSYVDMH